MTSRARTGCDLQSVGDVADAVRTFGARYLDRVYTPAEQDALSRGGASSLAARFAAKEAVLKLLGTADGVDLRTVEVVPEASGRPSVRLSGRAAELADRAGVGPIDVSLSHTGDLALAVAAAVVSPGAGRTPDGTPSSTPSSTPNTTRGSTATTTSPSTTNSSTTATPTGDPSSHE